MYATSRNMSYYDFDSTMIVQVDDVGGADWISRSINIAMSRKVRPRLVWSGKKPDRTSRQTQAGIAHSASDMPRRLCAERCVRKSTLVSTHFMHERIFLRN